jgi:L-amino acid N-acyltransferase YncA
MNIVLEFSGEAIGIAYLELKSNSSAVVSIRLHESFWGRGFGKRLLFGIVDNSEKLGFKSLTATVNKNNEPSLRLFENLNFRRVPHIVEMENNNFIELVRIN